MRKTMTIPNGTPIERISWGTTEQSNESIWVGAKHPKECVKLEVFNIEGPCEWIPYAKATFFDWSFSLHPFHQMEEVLFPSPTQEPKR